MTVVIFMACQVLLVGVLYLIERWRNPVRQDWVHNVQAWVCDLGASFLLLPFLGQWRGTSIFDGNELPFLIAFPIMLLARDGTEFFYHVCQHKIPVLWRLHSLHHSDPEMSALTTNRHFWGDQIVKNLTIWPFSTLICAPTHAMVLTYAGLSLYNYFIHANLKVDFGRWSWALNSPAYHRRHHSALREHYDTNFAALFPIWDVLCGTYRRPDGWPPSGQATAPENITEVLLWPFLKSKHPEEVGAEAVAA